LRVNSTLQSLNFEFNNIGANRKKALSESWGNRAGTLRI